MAAVRLRQEIYLTDVIYLIILKKGASESVQTVFSAPPPKKTVVDCLEQKIEKENFN